MKNSGSSVEQNRSSISTYEFPQETSTRMEESIWRINLADGSSQYERPRVVDCANFTITGTCKYGRNCRYNHPHDRTVVTTRSDIDESKQRVTRSVCKYFLRDGNCIYGDSCWFDHPKQSDGSNEALQPLNLNCNGYPRHLDKKECSFYMKTGKCRFGLDCIFDHPDPRAPPLYLQPLATTPSFIMPPSRAFSPPTYTNVASWEVGPYPSMLFSPRAIPLPCWNTYGHQFPVCPSYGQHGPPNAEPTCIPSHPMHVATHTPPAPTNSELVPSIVRPSTIPFSGQSLIVDDNRNTNDNDNISDNALSSPSSFDELPPELISSIESLLSSDTPPPSEVDTPSHDMLNPIFSQRVLLPSPSNSRAFS